MTPSKCRSCAASILWTRTAAGKSMPVNAEPDPEGNAVLAEGRDGLEVEVLTPIEVLAVPVGDRYMPHHATCPQADQWRRR